MIRSGRIVLCTFVAVRKSVPEVHSDVRLSGQECWSELPDPTSQQKPRLATWYLSSVSNVKVGAIARAASRRVSQTTAQVKLANPPIGSPVLIHQHAQDRLTRICLRARRSLSGSGTQRRDFTSIEQHPHQHARPTSFGQSF